jgi:hypothetical protein
MEIIIILIVILVVFYFFNTTNKKKEGFDFWNDLNSAFGGGNRQNSLNCDQMTMGLCQNPLNKMVCPTECQPDTNSWAQCREWAEKPGECDRLNRPMRSPMKEGGCKEVCDQQDQNIAAMKAIMDSNPMFKNFITTK